VGVEHRGRVGYIRGRVTKVTWRIVESDFFMVMVMAMIAIGMAVKVKPRNACHHQTGDDEPGKTATERSG
jgi:hypothetical protein